MLNHVRTLLMNESGVVSLLHNYPGEEVVDPSFRKLLLPPSLVRIRAILFGNDPDRAMLNYRLRQYMTLLHASELVSYVTAPDSRITYWPVRDTSLFNSTYFGTTVIQTAGPSATFYTQGDQHVLATNKLLYKWRVTVLNDLTVEVVNLTEPLSQHTFAYTETAGLSSRIPLPGTSIGFTFTAIPGVQWLVQNVARPATNITDVISALDDTATEADLKIVFGSTTDEPFLTFSNLWHYSQILPYRLSGLLLALAYRSDAIWNRI